MANIIVVFPKLEDAKSIRNLLNRKGFHVVAVCNTGAQVLNYADDLNEGIVVCGHKYPDMNYQDLLEYLPETFQMVLIASARFCEDARSDRLMTINMPLKLFELTETLTMIEEMLARRRRKQKNKPKTRNSEDRKIIERAKQVLMERNHMTEEEAHHYIQKCSMDSGTNMVETAQMVLTIM